MGTMKKFICFTFVFVCALIVNAQDADYAKTERQAEVERRAHYKEVVTQIFKDDELFVLFYLDLALVVDPTKETQVVERIATDNPWESLTKYIKGKSNIYFCPSGSQLSKAIEYLPCPIDSDILMSDKYGMYRLSSPEELFMNRGDSFRNSKHKAVVFGGLKYDEESSPAADNLLAFRGNREAIEGYRYLKSTYEEAVYIDSIFRRNGIETALLTSEDGTEQSFAQIPNHQVDILHIASHGFYEPEKDNTESTSLQEWMMSHTGLVLAGAEKETSDRTNDGRLTAYEVSKMDLSSVNLVVLSACDTGSGDIKENDVYGLLKGFKKGGAGTLLVTLSEVNDTVTNLLMKRFYDNLFRGDNPRRALENAQRYIRLHGNGQFNKLDYWTPFILVDDLDRNIGQGISDNTKREFLTTIIEAHNIYSEDNLFPNWNEIREQLRESDAIVRICPYSTGKDTADYVAMIGDAKDGRCHVVRLFSAINEKIGNYSIHKMDDIPLVYMDSMIWKPILPYIMSKQKLYCHCSGIVQYYPYEALPSVANDFQIYRMSSLNRLFGNREKIYIDNPQIVLFGGLNYDKANDMQEGFPEQPLERGVSYDFPYLYGTRFEVESIAKILSGTRSRVSLFTDNEGTETALRGVLENDSLKILHLSTHAFTVDFNLPINDLPFIGKQHSIIDHLFDCSGIALSGASESMRDGGIIRFQENDNILSGTEIANCHLSSLSLLVLSTCHPNTNIKTLTTADEQWDLIRAFKMAGGNTILHSLWNVDDESTSMLMNSFYQNIVSGHDVLDALNKAKQTIRSHKEKGWDNPRYWASFVLIDALE